MVRDGIDVDETMHFITQVWAQQSPGFLEYILAHNNC
jgi:hypothetical protein